MSSWQLKLAITLANTQFPSRNDQWPQPLSSSNVLLPTYSLSITTSVTMMALCTMCLGWYLYISYSIKYAFIPWDHSRCQLHFFKTQEENVLYCHKLGYVVYLFSFSSMKSLISFLICGLTIFHSVVSWCFPWVCNSSAVVVIWL